MARIKIVDLPKDRELTKDEIRQVTGGSLDGHSLLEAQAMRKPLGGVQSIGLLDARAAAGAAGASKIDRFILPNMMHDAGP
jgi:hypothetical protein